MSAMFCQLCGLEMVKEQRVLGDPALDCAGDCAGCIDEIESEGARVIEDQYRERISRVISRRTYPDIYDTLAEVYGGTTLPFDAVTRLANQHFDARDLLPLRQTPDGTPL